MKKRLFMTRPGATRNDPGSCFGFCSVPCEGTVGTKVAPQIAGISGAGRAGRLPVAEKQGTCRNAVFVILTSEGELGEF